MTNKQRQVGVILIATLFTALLMAVFLIGFIGVTTVDLNVSINHVETLQAYYIAEAGVARAIADIRENGLNNRNWNNITFPSGSSDEYTVTVDKSSGLIESSGQTAPLGFTRALEVSVSVSGSSAPYSVHILEWKEVGP
jgi:Tfp pilus assembly protein PilX